MFHKTRFCLQKFYLISMLFVLGKCASVNIVKSTHLTYLRIGTQFCLSRFTRLCFKAVIVQGIRFFSIGNSRLNCQIIESIFDMSLVYLHTCALESAASNFAISNFRERLWIFCFEPCEKFFKNSTTFHGKLARTKDEFRRISFALLLHNTVEDKIALLEKELDQPSASELQKTNIKEQLEICKSELEEIIMRRTQGAILRCKIKWYNDGVKNTKHFLNLEKRHFKLSTISQLKINEHEFVTSDSKILSECETFYKELYTTNKKAIPAKSEFFQLENDTVLDINEGL